MVEEKKEETPVEEEKPKQSTLEEVKAAIEEIKKEKAEFSAIRDELQQLRSDQLLSGTAGIREEPAPAKEETPAEYADKVMKGEVKSE